MTDAEIIQTLKGDVATWRGRTIKYRSHIDELVTALDAALFTLRYFEHGGERPDNDTEFTQARNNAMRLGRKALLRTFNEAFPNTMVSKPV